MGEPLDVTSLEPGTVLLDKYRVVETLGIGGMGVVVSADHVTLETRVALKFLLPKLMSNTNVAERFMREARAAIRINSDHVCKVMDVDTVPPDGPPFMVMEYLQGEDLAFHVESGRKFEVEEAIGLIVQAAEALAQAHRKGIVHRDIKPANLFVVDHGDQPPVVKVLDFGISKIVDDGDWSQQAALTKTTTVLGSGLYMSPEQMRSAKNVDHRTDIYALGVCLYELLTHTQPYTADSFAELCVKVSTEPPDPLRGHRPDVPEGLATVIERAYAAAPEDRPQTVAEFVEDLAPYAAAETRPAIDEIVAIVGGQRPTSPSLSPPPTAKSEQPERPKRPGQTTAEAAALATTTEAVTPAKPRVGLLVVGAAVVLAALAAVVVIVSLRDGATSTDTATPADTATTIEPPVTDSAAAEPTATDEPQTATEAEPDGDAGTEDAAPDAAAAASAPATATRPRPRPPRPKGPRIWREGGKCWMKDPKTRLQTEVPCPGK